MSISDLAERISIIDKRQQSIFNMLSVLDKRSINAYFILENLLNATNTVDDKIERFQWMYQTNSVLAHDNEKNFAMLEYICRIRKLFPIMSVDDEEHKLVRVGKADDGGYIMLDDYADSKIAYSFGIADDVSWDKAFVNAGGAASYQYDHTIESLPEKDTRFHWQKVGVCGVYDEGHPELKTLPMLIDENGHQNQQNMILKMDIEGAEYDVLSHLSENVLNQFSQIVIEFHHLTDPSWETMITAALSRINGTHQLIHIHANNYLPYTMVGGIVLPELLECTYLRRDKYRFKESTTFFPTILDAPNYWRHPDITLGTWK